MIITKEHFYNNPMKIFNKYLFLLSLTLTQFLISDLTFSQDLAEEQRIADNVGIISELVELPFIPSRAFLLMVRAKNEDLREIEKYNVSFVEIEKNTSKIVIYTGARISVERKTPGDTIFIVTFLFEDPKGQIAATPLKEWSVSEINKNTKNISQLRQEIERMTKQVVEAEQKMTQLDQRSKELRNIVSQIAGVEEIVKLRAELGVTKARIIEFNTDQERLNKLLQTAKVTTDLEDLDILRRELNIHLTEAAKATAMADRLNKRRKQSALRDIQDKMAVIKETANEDPKGLAKLALELRSERRRLEARLGETRVSVENQNEF